ncbi:hypothetical protein BWQ96_02096 [Gracilariopsis chorda]|uniref:Uncharacterized protein n=1 Tax=Gracilariopsis chorda TaxID=448386 RepID=A0A2V3J1A3_9FLOR|nr:hypothetical protein BWQ96_02096 [Gracilariopsis chorda]|eukprot:PXF48144.1 hypothetical protein BWQ96_02096 [Gracilariopsis chorda]
MAFRDKDTISAAVGSFSQHLRGPQSLWRSHVLGSHLAAERHMLANATCYEVT